MDRNELKKYLYKNRELNAKLSHYYHGCIFYNIDLEDGTYQFPISTVDLLDDSGESNLTYTLSSDIGMTKFENEIKASYLNRWIDKSIADGNFHKLH